MGSRTRLIWRDLRHYRIRSLLGISGIAVVVAAFVLLVSIARGIGVMFAGSEGSYRNFLLMETGSLDPCQGQIAPGIVARLSAMPDFDAVAPMLHSVVRAEERYIFVRAVPLDTYRMVEDIKMVEGQALGPGRVAMIGRALAGMTGWGVGRVIMVAGQPVRIAGMFAGTGIAESELWVNMDEGRRLLGRSGYSFILALASRGSDLGALRSMLAGDPVLRQSVDVYFEQRYWEKMSAATRQLEEAMILLSIVAAVTIAFGVFSIVAMTVAERRRAVGILKAVGWRGRDILMVFLGEGVLLGAAGAIVGLLLGAGAVAYLNRYPWLEFASVAVTPVFTVRSAAEALALAVVLALAGAYLPARRGARLPTVAALRGS